MADKASWWDVFESNPEPEKGNVEIKTEPGEFTFMNQVSRAELLSIARVDGDLSGESLDNITDWLSDPKFEEVAPDIEKLIEDRNWGELEDSFYSHLMIGTGGIRGPLGVGPNRINVRTIGEAAQGLCRFIEAYGSQAKLAGVVVGHEARKNSREFAILCCEVFAASGIRSYLFDGLRSTPEISFSVRHLHATAGVQITASHNPKTDNGFKFYWSDGAQVVPPLDAQFMRLVSEVDTIGRIPFSEALESGFVRMVGAEIDDLYIAYVRSQTKMPNRSAKIIFSPIHGAGSTNVLPVLEQEGFDIFAVPQQLEPDENFPTAYGDLINPEYREVMNLPIRLAVERDADIAICSDPDADRVGVAAKAKFGSSKMDFLSGNQVGAALVRYLLSNRKSAGQLSGNDVVFVSYVTTNLISDICDRFRVTIQDDLLVGFKFIAQSIGLLGDSEEFLFAAEESLGYLSGVDIRDKDAAIASLLICEMGSWLKDQGLTIPMFLDQTHREYGYYKNAQYLVELPGRNGRMTMEAIMTSLRQDQPHSIADRTVLRVIDRLDERLLDPSQYRLGDASDMITFVLSDDMRTRITVRPSGTEPKLKFYIQHYSPVVQELVQTKNAVDTIVERLGTELLSECGHRLSEPLASVWHTSFRRVV